jgi:hypothetical protein
MSIGPLPQKKVKDVQMPVLKRRSVAVAVIGSTQAMQAPIDKLVSISRGTRSMLITSSKGHRWEAELDSRPDAWEVLLRGALKTTINMVLTDGYF